MIEKEEEEILIFYTWDWIQRYMSLVITSCLKYMKKLVKVTSL